MRRNRILWGILWLLSICSISFFGGAISYGFFIVMSGIPVISLLYLIYVYAFFHIYQEIGTRTVVVNQSVPFYFRLVNEYWFSFVGVRVMFYSTFSKISGLSDETEYELLPHTDIKKQTNMICKYRGRYKAGIKTVEVQDFFRLFHLSFHNKESLNVIVMPELIQLDSLKSMEMVSQMMESRANATELDVTSRAYVPGDDIRQVHWSLTAKSGKLMIREKIGQEQNGIAIVLDTMRYHTEDKKYLPVENKMLETVLALAFYTVKKGMACREFHVGSVINHPKDKGKHVTQHTVHHLQEFDAFYRMISNVEFDNTKTQEMLFSGLTQMPEFFSCNAVFMVLHEWTKESQEMVLRLEQHLVPVIVYLVTDDGFEPQENEDCARVRFVRIKSDDSLKEVLE